ncbi:Mor transcription activator family [Chromobacterium violaceum]|uniref:Mor transcription activator family n=1 Tax=Chromobacterium violaceum TaxID=536 RepID=A0AAX2MAP0_CHRVL|nr:Mor transcription activator family [Chromobacterium violaceum]
MARSATRRWPRVIGVDAADIMTRHFGGEVLAIPRCASALREVRDRMIRAEFDEETRMHPASHAVGLLAAATR